MTNCPGLIAFIFSLCFAFDAWAQETEIIQVSDSSLTPDSSLTVVTPDSVKFEGQDVKVVTTEYDSTKETPQAKAALYSAALPGLGQAYNKKYWKIPIIYGTFAFMGYFIEFSHERYLIFRRLLLSETDPDPRTENNSNLSEDTLRRQTDQWRRNRDLMLGLTVLVYFLNVLDAHVDAHLKDFDVNDNLALKIGPSIDQVAFVSNPVPGISVKLKF